MADETIEVTVRLVGHLAADVIRLAKRSGLSTAAVLECMALEAIDHEDHLWGVLEEHPTFKREADPGDLDGTEVHDG